MQCTLLVNSSCRDILTILNIVYHSKGEMSHTSKCINIYDLNNLYLTSEEMWQQKLRTQISACQSIGQIVQSLTGTRKFTTFMDYLKGKNVINTRRDLRFVQIS